MSPETILIGASVPVGLEQLKTFRALKIGEAVLTRLPLEKAEALAVARYCKRHKITLYFSELLYRGTTELCWSAQRRMPREEFYTKAELEEIFDAAGEYYGGRMTLGEAGGVLYWLKAWTINRRARCYENLKPVQTTSVDWSCFPRTNGRTSRHGGPTEPGTRSSFSACATRMSRSTTSAANESAYR